MKNSKKLVALLLVLMLVIGGTVGGTLAWLIAETDPVVNTFTVGNIEITLTEDGANDVNGTLTQSFKMVPGSDIAKDPIVTVQAKSEACWLFVKVDAVNGVVLTNSTGTYSADDYITYTIADGWTLVDGTTNVYGRKVAASDAAQPFQVLAGTGTGDLKDGYVHVLDTVTKAMMDKVTDANAPKMTFTAYAIQSENLNAANAAAAWAQIKSDLSLS